MPKAQVNGINLYYESSGAGEPLLFIHSLGSSTRDWEPQVDAFSPQYRCITFDVRGHGRSEKPPGPYSVPQFAADAIGLLAHLGLDSAHVIGVSMGGTIAFQMAADAPEALRSMTIINSGPDFRLRTLRTRLAAFLRLVLFQLLSMERNGKMLAGRLFPDEEQAALRQKFISRWSENDKRAYMAATRAGAGWSVSEHLASMNIPALILASDQDFTPVEFKREYASKMPNAELVVIPDARHAVTVAQPEKANAPLASFLDRLLAQNAGAEAGA